MRREFTLKDIGCHADGSFGHQHVRERLCDLLIDAAHEPDPLLIESLKGEMPDDAWDEDAALDVVQDATDGALYWAFVDGDLVLCEDIEDAYYSEEVQK